MAGMENGVPHPLNRLASLRYSVVDPAMRRVSPILSCRWITAACKTTLMRATRMRLFAAATIAASFLFISSACRHGNSLQNAATLQRIGFRNLGNGFTTARIVPCQTSCRLTDMLRGLAGAPQSLGSLCEGAVRSGHALVAILSEDASVKVLKR
jgi:hypothetical protein